MMETRLEQLFRKFRQNIILEANDTKQHYWEAYIVQLAEKAEQFNYKHVDPHKFMTFPDPNCKILQRLDSLENACYCLSQYALNLCRNPAVDDFNLLKTYTGYYAVNINSVMENHDLEVLKLMGYKVRDNCENADEFVLSKRSQFIEYLGFELFLCQAYYRRMRQVCQEALGLKFKGDVIVAMLLQYSLQDIAGFGLQELCQKILQESKKNHVEPVDTRTSTYEYLDPHASTGSQWKQNRQPNDHLSIHLAGHQEERRASHGVGQSHSTSRRLVDTAEDDDDDLYGGDADIVENTVKTPPAPPGFANEPPLRAAHANVYENLNRVEHSTPPGFANEPPSRAAHANVYENLSKVGQSSINAHVNINNSTYLQNKVEPSSRAPGNVYGDDYLNKVQLPGENRSHSFTSVNKNRSSGTGDSYAERAAGSINRMQRQSSLSDKRQNTTGLVRSEEPTSGSPVIGGKPSSVSVTVKSTPNRVKDGSENIFYKSNDDDEIPMTGKRQSLKDRNRNVDHSITERAGNLKRTHITSHAPASEDAYMHLDTSAKQLNSQVPRGGGTRAGSGKSSPAYETVVGHDTVRGGSRSQGSQNIPSLYSTETPSSPSSQH